jgi:hypothetical protein
MRNQTSVKAVVFCSLLVLVVPTVEGAAQPPSSRRGGLYGDWEVKVDYGERQMDSILAFSRDAEGNRTGQWISFWGLGELKDLKYEGGQLSFAQVYRFGDNEFTSKFTGTIEDGKLTGTLSSDRGQYKLEGKPAKRIPRVVGSWEVKFKMGEREITSTLVVKADKEGELTAEWPSERVEHQITDVQYERGRLTFKRKSKMGDREWESTFDGSIQRETDTLSGVIKSERGEITAEGKRIGAPLIGTWNLDVTSERGSRKQRLKVNRDMSGLYGAIPIKKVNFEDDKISFKVVLEFGERKFEMSFDGKLAESKEPKELKLTGELKTSRGSQKVAGKKVISTFRRPGTR